MSKFFSLNRRARRAAIAAVGPLFALAMSGQAVLAQATPPISLGFYGTPGLIDMPTAEKPPEGQISTTAAHMRYITRNTMMFQITPRLTTSFRYSAHVSAAYKNFDRSLDVHFQFMDEGKYRPAMAVGLRDIIGTGWYSSEFVVATKHIGPRLKVTGGIGWGRLASRGGFTNPLSGLLGSGFNTRPGGTLGLGGVPAYNRWFRGPAAFFGGIEWQTPIERLTFKAEYSSDAYTIETGLFPIIQRSPFNYALNYRLKSGTNLSAYYLFGSRVGFSVAVTLNPKFPANASNVGPAPQPVLTRPDDRPYDKSWTRQSDGAKILRANISTLLARNRLQLEALAITATSAEIRFRNTGYDAAPEAIGRVARILTQSLPNSVETFVIVPVVKGIPAVAITLKRSDIEALEHDPKAAQKMYQRAKITAAGPLPAGGVYADGRYPKAAWSIGPYADISLFDPSSPARVDLGLRLKGRYEMRPGLIISGAVHQKLVGNLGATTLASTSMLNHVRSDSALYDQQGTTAIDYLMAEYFFRPGVNLYGRVSVGYLEEMFGGLSTEILWKPVDSKFALGVELNAVKQRAFNQLLGFQRYGVITGRATAYWDMGNGFFAQADIGRYLAGDYGVSIAVDRVFDNGWRLGAAMTLTNVPFSTFGEGSFDKSLRFSVPLSWLTGKPSTKAYSSELHSLTRDGGARIKVRNPLYSLVQDYQGDRLKRRWGRFWR